MGNIRPTEWRRNFSATTSRRGQPRNEGPNKKTLAAIVISLGGLGAAHAQSDMSCADLLKANAQIDAATKAEMAKDATAAALDRKINDHCTKNPTAKASEAMEKAMSQ